MRLPTQSPIRIQPVDWYCMLLAFPVLSNRSYTPCSFRNGKMWTHQE